jgi:hypothetical protein
MLLRDAYCATAPCCSRLQRGSEHSCTAAGLCARLPGHDQIACTDSYEEAAYNKPPPETTVTEALEARL